MNVRRVPSRLRRNENSPSSAEELGNKMQMKIQHKKCNSNAHKI